MPDEEKISSADAGAATTSKKAVVRRKKKKKPSGPRETVENSNEIASAEMITRTALAAARKWLQLADIYNAAIAADPVDNPIYVKLSASKQSENETVQSVTVDASQLSQDMQAALDQITIAAIGEEWRAAAHAARDALNELVKVL